MTGGLLDQLAGSGDQVMEFLRAGYDPVSPDGPEHFPVVFAKTLWFLGGAVPAVDWSAVQLGR